MSGEQHGEGTRDRNSDERRDHGAHGVKPRAPDEQTHSPPPDSGVGLRRHPGHQLALDAIEVVAHYISSVKRSRRRASPRLTPFRTTSSEHRSSLAMSA